MKRYGRKLAVSQIVRIAFVAFVALSSVESTVSVADPAGSAVFDRAKTLWAMMKYPEVTEYVVAVTVTSAGNVRTDRYTGEVKSTSGEFRVNKFSDYEIAHPHVPHGINFVAGFSAGMRYGPQTVDGIVLNPPAAVERFAVPEISPLYSFGIRSCSSRTANRVRADDNVKVIGSIATNADRRYRVTIVGDESVDGQETTHLALIAVSEPKSNRLRDVWVAKATGAVVQARTDGNFSGKSASGTPWLVHFVTTDGATYIESEATEAPLKWGRARLDSVRIVFEHVQAAPRSLTLAFAIPADLSNLNAVVEPSEDAAPSGCPARP